MVPQRGVNTRVIDSPLTAAPSPSSGPQAQGLRAPVSKTAGARRPQKAAAKKPGTRPVTSKSVATQKNLQPTQGNPRAELIPATPPEFQGVPVEQTQSDYEAEFPGFAQPETFIRPPPEDNNSPARDAPLEDEEDDEMDLDVEDDERG
jgi:hypothetical protein